MAETGRILRALGRTAFAGGLLAIGASPALGASFTVTSTVDAADVSVGNGDCLAIVGVLPDPLPPFVFGCTLRAALQEANFAPGEDTIIVPAGSFAVALAVTGVDDAGGDLDVTDDVVITGAGSASTILDASALPVGQPALAITDPALADADTVQLLLAGVTIADSPAEGLFSANTTTHFELDDVVIRGSGGYGVRKNGVLLDQITHSRIAENTNVGLYSVNGDLDIAASVVEANSGGGILNLRGALTVKDSAIRGNTGDTGGIYHNGTSLQIVRTTIHDNHSTNRGGGLSIDNVGGPNVIRDTTFSANSTISDGGAISTYDPVTIANSTLSGNQANGDGGGVFASGSPAVVRIHNCTIYGNTADADANATGQGGGIAQDYSSEIRVADSVLANNTAAPAAGRDCAGTIVSEGYNVIRIDDCGGFSPAADLEGSDGAPLDAQLGPLADNGGPTFTQMPAVTSPVVDFGAPAGCPIDDDGLPGTPYVPLLADQRGAPRPRDGDGDGFARCDVGAVEVPEPGAGAASVASWLALCTLARRTQIRRAATNAVARTPTPHPKTRTPSA